jgi:hypothetical protein
MFTFIQKNLKQQSIDYIHYIFYIKSVNIKKMNFLMLSLVLLSLIDNSIQQPAGGPMGTTTTTTVTNYNYPSSAVSAASDQMITSWVKSTGYSSSWKAYTNVNKVQYSSTYVYVSASGNKYNLNFIKLN